MKSASAPLRPGAALPHFELPDLAGSLVRSDRLLGALSLTLFLVGDGRDEDWLARLPRVQEQVDAWGGILLVVIAAGREAAKRLRAMHAIRARILLDESALLHERLGQTGPEGRPRPALLIFQRGGVLRCRLDAAAGGELEDALEWIRYLGILEPECSTCVPAWPAELLGEEEAA